MRQGVIIATIAMKHVLRILNTPLNPMHCLLVGLVCLVIADGLLTQCLLKEGLAREGNTLLQPIVDRWHFVLVKAVGVIACALILWDIYTRSAKLALVSTSFLVLGYLAVDLWNVSIYLNS